MTSSTEPDCLESQLRQALAELERRIHLGDDCRAEAFFTTFPGLAANVNTAIEMIYAEFAARREAGQKPVRDDYYRRFPQWQAELRIQFEVDEKLGDVLPDVREIRITGPDGTSEPYHVLTEIWRSANGNVEKAINVRLNRIDAVKTLVNGDGADTLRFCAGAREQARLRHGNILPVHLVGETEEGAPCFAMEFAEGGSLARQIAGKPQAPEKAARLIRTLAEAIAYAHLEGVVHRDLKPANVVLTSDGTPKITDFGLVRRLDALDGPSKTGDILGTPEYMAPEQAAGRTESVGPLSDVYALGAILFELLTGRPPFQGKTVVEVLNKVVKKDPIRPSRVVCGVPRGLESICLKCLEKNPKRRYGSAQELADDLGRWLGGRRPMAHRAFARARRIVGRNRRISATAALLLLVVTVAPVVAYAFSPERDRERIERDLAAGKEVLLIGEKGLPKWHRWATGDGTEKHQLTKGAFQISAAGLALKELVRDPQHSRYRLSARMRHDEEYQQRMSEMGVYFAYGSWGNNDADISFCTVALNGYLDWRGPQNPTLKGNPVHLGLLRASNLAGTQSRPLFIPVSWPPVPDWINLAVEVSPEQVRFAVWRDGQSPVEFRDVTEQGVQTMRKHLFPESPPADLGAALRGSLGLFIKRGAASFENVVLTPMN